MKTALLLVFMFVVMFNFSFAQEASMTSEQQTLLETDRAWATAAETNDIETLTTYWTDDAVIYFPERSPVVGKEAIEKFVRKNRTIPGFSLHWEPVTAEIAKSGDLAFTSGTFRLSVNDAEGNPVERTGHYLCMWKKQDDGSWKCAIETSVFDAPKSK